MSRLSRYLKDGRIAIVCEGSETEAPFLREVKSLLEKLGKRAKDELVIYPKAETKPANPNAKKKSHKSKAPAWCYYYTTETNQQDYDTYKAQPTRYVREAQLLMEQEGYYCAWAVFDNDKFAHLNDAFNLCEQQQRLGKKLFIAYSSISIEESLLLSHERCSTNFGCSADVIAYMISRGYIKPGYAKGDAWINFGSLILDINSGLIQNSMLFNSTWSQQLENTKPIYARNPYSDFEKLLQFLSKDEREIRWIHSGEEFDLDKSRVKIEDRGNTYQVTNINGSPIVLNSNNCGFINVNLSLISALTTSAILNTGNSIVINKQAPLNFCLLFGNKWYIAY